MLAVLICLTAWSQETNDLEIFYTPEWQAAWEPLGEIYLNDDNHLCIPNEVAATGRLLMWHYYFNPEPFNNIYHDQMLDLEVQIEDRNVELHMAEQRLKNSRKKYLIIGSLAFASGLITGILILK